MIINLTPHDVNIYDEDKTLIVTVPPSGTVARIAAVRERIGVVDGVTLYRTTYGKPEGLPGPSDAVIYVVSGLLRAAVPQRSDLWQPGEAVRNDAGQVIGSIGLSQ